MAHRHTAHVDQDIRHHMHRPTKRHTNSLTHTNTHTNTHTHHITSQLSSATLSPGWDGTVKSWEQRYANLCRPKTVHLRRYICTRLIVCMCVCYQCICKNAMYTLWSILSCRQYLLDSIEGKAQVCMCVCVCVCVCACLHEASYVHSCGHINTRALAGAAWLKLLV